MRLNRTPGAFQIRIFASKEQARAGLVSVQYISEPGSRVAARPGRWRKWIVAAAIAAGGAAAGILAAGSSENAPASTSIGQPSIVVVRP
jgi:hypothetical protein